MALLDADKRPWGDGGVNRKGTRWRGQIPIPAKAHPLVKAMVGLMNKHGVTFTDLEEDVGLCRQSMSDWRYRRQPKIDNFDAALNAIGYKLQIVELEKHGRVEGASYQRAVYERRAADEALA